MEIKVFTCGGTFEKVYDPIAGTLGFQKSSIPDLVKKSRLTIKIDFEPLFFKDSLDMTHDDRLLVSTRINAESMKNIVIIHGTDTMVDTAKTIKENKPRGKVIVITGAMIPYSIKQSDAMFNFGSALAAAQLLTSGVWISMNGRIFGADDVRKNKNEGLFETQ